MFFCAMGEKKTHTNDECKNAQSNLSWKLVLVYKYYIHYVLDLFAGAIGWNDKMFQLHFTDLLDKIQSSYL